MTRCPNGTRRNKKTGNCEPTKSKRVSSPTPIVNAKKSRCPKGTQRNKKTGNCEPKKVRMPTPPVRMPTPPVRMPTPPVRMPTPPVQMPTPPVQVPIHNSVKPYIAPYLYDMSPNDLKNLAKTFELKIETDINKLNVDNITKEQKKLNKEYDMQLENMRDEEDIRLFGHLIQIINNTSEKGPGSQVVGLKQLVKLLKLTKASYYKDLDEFYPQACLIIMSNYK